MEAARQQDVPRFASMAVCYRCQYVGQEASGNRCPSCGFPVIMETRLVPAGPRRVRDILDRSSISLGAPPLPGVDRGPRKAQLLAEARRRRISEVRQATPQRPVRFPTGTGSGTAVEPVSHAWTIGLALVAAMVLGVAAAILVHGRVW